MASPITTWEGAEAYFTYADSGAALGFFLALAVLLVIGVIAATWAHEQKSFASLDDS
ncbi:MAG: hypothetical protein RLW62_16650 [Gammaproteobacteria bacterium]